MTIQVQRAQVRSVLRKLAIIDRNAVCGGGAPRNWREDKLARDFDFFLHISAEADVPKLLAHVLGTDVAPVQGDASYEGEYIKGVWQYVANNMEYQFIILKELSTPMTIAEHFTCNASQIIFNGYQYIKTPAYTKCHEDKVLTFDFRMHGYKEDYLIKMMDYYPTYTVDMDSLHFPANMRPENEPNTIRTNDIFDSTLPPRPSPAVSHAWVSF